MFSSNEGEIQIDRGILKPGGGRDFEKNKHFFPSTTVQQVERNWNVSQAQSPIRTRGARSWLSSVADTGAPFMALLLCLRLASLELDGGERRMEHAPAVTTWGDASSCRWASRSSCSASCRFTAIACPAKNVRSLALLFLWAQMCKVST